MPELTLVLNLPQGKVLQYYRGVSHTVQARATTGQLVQFPASALQRHVTPDGVHGRFRIRFSDAFKFEALDRIV